MKGRWWTDIDLRKLLGLVASAWVDPRSSEITATLPRKSTRERYASLSITKPEVAKFFLIRSQASAADDPSDQRWHVANVTAVCGEKVSADILDEVRKELMSVLGSRDAADLQDDLNAFEDVAVPIFITMPASGFPKEVLDQLRSEFGTVSCLFLTDGRIKEDRVFTGAGVERITPEVNPEDEKALFAQYDKFWRILRPRPGVVS
jgi:hypothetical protein